MKCTAMRVAVFSETLAELGGGERHGLALLEPLLGLHEIDLFYQRQKDFEPRLVQERFGIRLSEVRWVPYDHPWHVSRRTRDYDLLLNITFGSLLPSRATKNILMVYCPLPLADRGRASWLQRWDHQLLRWQHALIEWLDSLEPDLLALSFGEYRVHKGLWRAAGRLPLFLVRKLAWSRKLNRYRLGRPYLVRYDLLLAISAYTAKWIKNYYGRSSEIVYPAIDADRFVPGAKEPLILTVGRFAPEPFSKGHHVMLAVFKALSDAGRLRGWRLCLCGGSNGSPAYEQYIERLRRASAGYAVSVEVNLPLAKLVDLYGKASLYWHAMGYEQEVEKHPWRFEHFGMTTVEAMAAGCIPMVLNGGGQPEIVTHGRDGFLWSSLDELQEQVGRFLTLDAEAVANLRAAARQRARYFSRANFLRRVCELYRRLAVPCRDPLALDRPSGVA
jgi:glycosyltransferase involved in cell wall biosynthesis